MVSLASTGGRATQSAPIRITPSSSSTGRDALDHRLVPRLERRDPGSDVGFVGRHTDPVLDDVDDDRRKLSAFDEQQPGQPLVSEALSSTELGGPTNEGHVHVRGTVRPGGFTPVS